VAAYWASSEGILDVNGVRTTVEEDSQTAWSFLGLYERYNLLCDSFTKKSSERISINVSNGKKCEIVQPLLLLSSTTFCLNNNLRITV
jgi:hypothetical protein